MSGARRGSYSHKPFSITRALMRGSALRLNALNIIQRTFKGARVTMSEIPIQATARFIWHLTSLCLRAPFMNGLSGAARAQNVANS
jgi:hypothetical protein